MNRILLPTLAAMLAVISGLAQQPAQPQPTTQPAPQVQITAPATAVVPTTTTTALAPGTSQGQTTGCSTPAPKPPSGFHFKIPTKVQQVIDANRAKIEDKTGVHVPTTDELKKQITQSPCPPGPAPAPAAPAKPPAAPTVPPATPAPTPVPVNAKP